MKKIRGIDLSKVSNPFDVKATGKVALIDGDFLVYSAAATTKNLDTAIRRFYTNVLEKKFIMECDRALVFITPTGNNKCGRYLLPSHTKYQSTRKHVFIPLRDPLREHLKNHIDEYNKQKIRIGYDMEYEADDLLIMYSYVLEDKGILWSGDKDLRLTPYPYWVSELAIAETISNRYGYIDLDKEKVNKVIGRGLAFFFWQLLGGDRVDSVQGIKRINNELVGAKRAFNYIKQYGSEGEAAAFVINAYRESEQNLLAEAECLWLKRWKNDTAYDLFMELVSTEEDLNTLNKWKQEIDDACTYYSRLK